MPDTAPRIPFALQLMLWGYALDGDAGETSAIAAESFPWDRQLWDRTAADLDGDMVAYGDGPPRRVADHAALPWVTEHVTRGHAEWPGL